MNLDSFAVTMGLKLLTPLYDQSWYCLVQEIDDSVHRVDFDSHDECQDFCDVTKQADRNSELRYKFS
jgi:hypothetical protein